MCARESGRASRGRTTLTSRNSSLSFSPTACFRACSIVSAGRNAAVICAGLAQSESCLERFADASAGASSKLSGNALDEVAAADRDAAAPLGDASLCPCSQSAGDVFGVSGAQFAWLHPECVGECRPVDYANPLRWVLDLAVATGQPLRGVLYDTCPHHVQIDVHQTAGKMFPVFDGGGMVAIFPECSPPVFATIKLLAGAACDELHAAGDLAATAVTHHQVHVIARDVVIEHA